MGCAAVAFATIPRPGEESHAQVLTTSQDLSGSLPTTRAVGAPIATISRPPSSSLRPAVTRAKPQ